MLDVGDIQTAWGKTGGVPVQASTGVLTAADARFFPGVQILSASLGDAVPLAVVDLGLNDEQRAWCRSQPSRTVQTIARRIVRDVPRWQQWNKPYFIAQSPFRRTLWIDADCVVVGDLAPLFEELDCGPFVAEHWDDPYLQPNAELLYRFFPVPVRTRAGQGLNSGVVGLDVARDVRLLKAWRRLSGVALDSYAVRTLISWFDEGTMHWAIQSAMAIDRILPRPGWNRFMTSQPSADPIIFLLSLTRRPDDVIWHFSGAPKPW
jgi:hypothetical protein